MYNAAISKVSDKTRISESWVEYGILLISELGFAALILSFMFNILTSPLLS